MLLTQRRWCLTGTAAVYVAVAAFGAPLLQKPAAPALTEPDQIVFRSGVDLGRLAFTVRHRDGHLVTDLTRNDFRVLVDRAPVPVVFFDAVPQPLTVALMIDVATWAPFRPWMQASGRAFVDALQSSDWAAVGSYSWEVAISPFLTRDRRVLHRVLDEEIWPGSGTGPVGRAVDLARTAVTTGPSGQRRAVVVVTDDYAPMDHPDDVALGGVARRAADVGVIVYSLRLGPDGSDAWLRPRPARHLAFATGGGSRWAVVPAPCWRGVLNFGRVSARDAYDVAVAGCRPEEHPARLAELRSTAAQIVEELRREYVVGIHVPASEDDREHRLRVEVLRPDLTPVGVRRVLRRGES